MQDIECEGKTVSDAVESALKQLGLRREQAEVKIIQEAKSGFMGFGAKPAIVRVGEKKWRHPDDPAAPSAPAAPKREARSSNGRSQARNGERRPAREPRESRPAEKPAARTQAQPKAQSAQAPATPPDDAEKERITQTISQILAHMGIAGTQVEVSWEDKQERLKARITGGESEQLLGEEGRALEALQTVTNSILNRRGQSEPRIPVQLDAAGWREKKESEMLQVLDSAVAEVKRTGKPYRLEPMSAADRRLVHKQLADHPDIVTGSEGEGSWRKIVIRPRKK
ncbi:MAG: Jag N-terminal domain-containing protein [Elusimicrobia bacterium]|nr:Jag N-terminal domain-containing protein [Elusimicrobiota bacterium]